MNIELCYEYLPYFIKGASFSITIAILGCLIGFVIGSLLAVVLYKSSSILKVVIFSYINLIRGTPMLIQILFLYFVLPVINIQIPSFWVAVLAIGLNSSAYVTNIIRTGIQAVDSTQYETAQVIGLSHIQILRLIIFPQAIRVSLPALGNEFITLIKDSSLASVIGVFELTKQGELMMHKTYDALSSYTLVALVYLAMTLSLSLLLIYIEKKVLKHVSR